MALADAIKGGLRPSQQIVWMRPDGLTEDLTGATLSGRIRSHQTGETRAITGQLTVVSPTAGSFRWDYSAVDVQEAGLFTIQFKATYLASPTPAFTSADTWQVLEAV
jgi:hypothetical protein